MARNIAQVVSTAANIIEEIRLSSVEAIPTIQRAMARTKSLVDEFDQVRKRSPQARADYAERANSILRLYNSSSGAVYNLLNVRYFISDLIFVFAALEISFVAKRYFGTSRPKSLTSEQ